MRTWLLRKIRPAAPPVSQLKRLYQWRRPDGSVLTEGYAINACVFWLASYATQRVRSITEEELKDPKHVGLKLYVASTGEHVKLCGIESQPGVKARLHDAPDLLAYNLEGKPC